MGTNCFPCSLKAITTAAYCRKAIFTLAFMHLAGAFICSNLYCIQGIHFISLYIPWELNHRLASTMFCCLSYRNAVKYSVSQCNALNLTSQFRSWLGYLLKRTEIKAAVCHFCGTKWTCSLWVWVLLYLAVVETVWRCHWLCKPIRNVSWAASQHIMLKICSFKHTHTNTRNTNATFRVLGWWKEGSAWVLVLPHWIIDGVNQYLFRP